MSSSNRDNIKAKRGRPKTTGVGLLIGLRWHQPELDEIDDWRREEKDMPSRAEALRRLVKLGLSVKRSKK